MARGLARVLGADELTVIVNVGDDDVIHGVHVSADLDTVVYTLADIEGPHGWGVADDTFTTMDRLAELGEDTTFRLGDRDLATCLARSTALGRDEPLSEITTRIRTSLGVMHTVLPVTDDRLRTRLFTVDGDWLAFQEYFVIRRHRDEIIKLEYEGAATATPAPGVLDAIAGADTVIIAPSNPPLSIHPILAVPGVRDAVAAADHVAAVSPLFGGRALKGPADRIMASLGLPPGTAGVLTAYDGLIDTLVIDDEDTADVALTADVAIVTTDTRIADPEAAARFATWLLDLA
jgi:LPPG:FO 2-phospho-L-lactate transferase